MDRRALGSWLQGPRGAGIDLGYPGQRLGRPESGPGSVAGFGARLLAFAVDAVVCDLVALALFRDLTWVTAIFAVQVLVLTTVAGGSVGQLACRLRVRRLDGDPASAGRVLVRTLLLLLLVPALVWDRDGRGLHDQAAATVLVRV